MDVTVYAQSDAEIGTRRGGNAYSLASAQPASRVGSSSVNGALLVKVDDSVYGRELWSLPTSAIGRGFTAYMPRVGNENQGRPLAIVR